MSDWPPALEEILALPVDVLAVRLLRRLQYSPNSITHRNIEPGNSSLNLMIPSNDPYVWRALNESYHWLLSNGFLAHTPGRHNTGEFAYITRRGQQLLKDTTPLETIRASRLVEVDLHPSIANRVRREFLSGEYESAVFIAFREVEIRVRDLGGFDNSMVGTRLMTEAFNPSKNGPLVDPNLDPGEQQATMQLFIGAIGAFKNPSSHRQVDYGDATVAAEAVLLADLLLRILDRYPSASKADT